MIKRVETKQKNLTIEIIRIVAATLIVIYHYLEGIESNSIFVEGKWSLSFLCELFFMISGFYSYQYISKIYDGMNFKTYFKKRISKILVVLAASVLIEAFLYVLQYWCGIKEEIQFTLLQVLINAVGIQSWGMFSFKSINGPSWYVSVLFLCLIILFFICKLSKKLKINHQILFAMLILIGTIILYFGIDAIFATSAIARGYISFYLGLILACNINRIEKKGIGYYIAICMLPVLFFIIMLSGKIGWYFVIEGMYIILLWAPIVVLAETCFRIEQNKLGIIALLGGCTLDVYLFNEPATVLRNLVMGAIIIDLNHPLSMVGFVIFNWMIAIAIHYLERIIYPKGN